MTAKTAQWGDTILAVMFGLALAAVACTIWLCFTTGLGAGSDSFDSPEAESSAHGSIDPLPHAAWPWVWALGAVASSTAAVLLLRRFRDDRNRTGLQQSAGASGANPEWARRHR